MLKILMIQKLRKTSFWEITFCKKSIHSITHSVCFYKEKQSNSSYATCDFIPYVALEPNKISKAVTSETDSLEDS